MPSPALPPGRNDPPSRGGSALAPEDAPVLDDPRRVEVAQRIIDDARRLSADRLSRLAARLLGTAHSQISIVTAEQRVLGAHGLDPASTDGPSPSADSLCTVTMRHGGPLAVEDAANDERVSSLPPVATGAVGSYLGVPLRVFGQTVGALCVFDPHPQRWDAERIVLLTELAESVEAELQLVAVATQLADSTARLGLAYAAAAIGSFDWDLITGHLSWDERLQELFGYGPGEFGSDLGSFTARLHPDDRQRAHAALDAAISSRGEYDTEYRVLRPDGSIRWVAARGRVLCDEDGRPLRMIGAAHETTEAHDASERVGRLLETMTDAFFSLDRDWRFTYLNTAAERVLDVGRVGLLGTSFWDLPGVRGALIEHELRTAVAESEHRSYEAAYGPEGRRYEVSLWPGPDGLSVFFHDVTDRWHAEEQQETARRRLALIAAASAELAATMDVEEAVRRLGPVIVPALADWCVVSLADQDSGALRHLGHHHHDPERAEDMRRWALSDDGTRRSTLVERALETGRPEWVDHMPEHVIGSGVQDEGMLEVAARLGAESVAVIPLRARGRILGVLTLVNGAGRGPVPQDDRTAAEELANRAALALDNARLFNRQRRLSETLQRSMLSAPPQPENVHVVTRYEPAVLDAQVGGDWYDSFIGPHGGTMLVIGDVMGHDVEAAAAMGQLRTMVRTLASDRDGSPADVLYRTDHALQALGVHTFATALVASVEQREEDRPRGVRQLRWSSAGHLPAMLCLADGTTTALAASGPMLGIGAGTPRSESSCELPERSTVLLYTDGLVERRGEPIDMGLERLQDALQELHELSLDELCDALLERLLPDGSEDDVALVALRLA